MTFQWTRIFILLHCCRASSLFFIHRIPCDYLKYLILLEGMCFILSTMEW